ncbi:hypothetical protein EV421DRAFT_1907525 [Armillaria borealis]|uniref:Secreted protein n=1 Tax=Armillaria borealis TaxID=47425 RepID=A0AA39MKY8_9AGAR|nr:hypothetical protein EV421DRAFT_1907525 [Armillaria borealis]
MYLLFSFSFGCLQTSACTLDTQPVASCVVSRRLADSVYSARAAGGVNYPFCDLGDDLDAPDSVIPRSLLRHVSLHLVILPNAILYIPAQPVAPCMFRAALRTMCTAHGPLVECMILSAMLGGDLDMRLSLVRFVLGLSFVFPLNG